MIIIRLSTPLPTSPHPSLVLLVWAAPKGATSADMPLLHLQSSEGKLTVFAAQHTTTTCAPRFVWPLWWKIRGNQSCTSKGRRTTGHRPSL